MGEDYIDQLLSSGQPDTIDNIVKLNRFWDPSNYDATVKDGTVLQPQYEQSSGVDSGGFAGPVTGVLRYKEGQTSPGQTYEILDPVTGEVTGTGRFKDVGNVWDLTKQAAADLGPILNFTPLAPFVRGINALSAAERGDILGALASGLPLADKIPGLDPATASTLKNIGRYASVGKAAQSGDWQQVLNAASQIPGIGNSIPQEVKTLSGYASQADALQRAAKGDPSAIIGLAKSFGALPTSKLADVTGADAIEGFFAPGGEGYYDPEAKEFASGTSMDPMELSRFLEANVDGPAAREVLLQDYFPEIYGRSGADTPTTTTFTPGSDDVYEDIESLLARYENQGFADQPIGATDQTLEITGRRDNMDIDPWLQPFVDPERRVNVTEGEPQTIEVTGKREGTIIPDWDILPDVVTEVPDRTPGSPTDTTPGTVEPDDDRTAAPAPSPAPSPSPSPSPAPSPAPKPAPSPTFTMPTGGGGGPTVFTPIMFQGPEFDVNSMLMQIGNDPRMAQLAQMANENEMSFEDLMQILSRG